VAKEKVRGIKFRIHSFEPAFKDDPVVHVEGSLGSYPEAYAFHQMVFDGGLAVRPRTMRGILLPWAACIGVCIYRREAILVKLPEGRQLEQRLLGRDTPRPITGGRQLTLE
jgi:hypothetical protein